jgi:hypothetical protein
MTPEHRLCVLFEDSFSSPELRSLLLEFPSGQEILKSMPGKDAPPAEQIMAVTLALKQHGLLETPDPVWSKIVRRRPFKARMIRQVARAWGVELPLLVLARPFIDWTSVVALAILALILLRGIWADLGHGRAEAHTEAGFCGDGIHGDGEECDHAEGNGPGRTCNTACRLNACGDGDKGPAEACDDGKGNGVGKACSAACRLNVCGDGDQGPAEECDLGEGNGVGKACSAACKLNVCGDGDKGPGEECDLGGMNGPGKTCNATCKFNVCGDGNKGPGEECDLSEGNGPGKPCDDQCQLPAGKTVRCATTTTRDVSRKNFDLIERCTAHVETGFLEASGIIRPLDNWEGVVQIRVCYLPEESCNYVASFRVPSEAPITRDTRIQLESVPLNFRRDQLLRIHLDVGNPENLSVLAGFRVRLKPARVQR